jgi:hypothetical protein
MVTGFLAIYGVFHGAYRVISDGYGVFLWLRGFLYGHIGFGPTVRCFEQKCLKSRANSTSDFVARKHVYNKNVEYHYEISLKHALITFNYSFIISKP